MIELGEGMPSVFEPIDLRPNLEGMHDFHRRAAWVSPKGHLYLGQLLDFLDWRAGAFAKQFLPDNTGPVTVGLQGTKLQGMLDLNQNYGVNFVLVRSGSKSLDVQADLLAMPYTAQAKHLCSFYLTFVVVDESKRPIAAAQDLIPSSDLERALHDASLTRKAESVITRDLYRNPPQAQQEFAEMQGSLRCEDTVLEQPSYLDAREINFHGTGYGGALMRNMYRLAWNGARVTLTRLLGKEMPLPLTAAINHVTFDMPVFPNCITDYRTVSVGSSGHSLVQRVELYAHPEGVVTDRPEKMRSNTATFTFVPVDADGNGVELPERGVVPGSIAYLLPWTEANRARELHQRSMPPLLLHNTTTALLAYRA